jgi:arylesterase/paraoxonase
MVRIFDCILIFASIFAILAILVTIRLHFGGEFKELVPTNGDFERCAKIGPEMIGAEDIVLSRKLNRIFVSAMDRRTTNAIGGLWALDPESLRYQKIRLDNYTFAGFHPHGISLLETDQDTYLFVINHLEKHYVDVFKMIDPFTMRLIKRYSHNLFISPNDLVAVSPDEFYITNDHGSSGMAGKTMEDLLMLKWSNVVHVKKDDYKTVISGLSYGNGIDVSADKKLLYVAETVGEAVSVYDRETLKLISKTDVWSGADNLFIDGEDIYVASHPKLFSFVMMAAKLTPFAPTQIQRVFKQDGVTKWENIYLNLGSDVSDASTGIIYKNRLFMGSVFDKGVTVCNKKRGKP